MSDYFLDQIAELRRQVAGLKQSRVTYRAATVSAVDAGASTFDADVAGAGTLTGIAAEAAFLPAVGDTVRLSLVGATPIYQPRRIGANAVGYTELSPVVGGDISNAILTSTNAMTAANGKNKVTYSAVAAPTSGISGTVAGDPWFQRNTTTGVITGSWEWDGTAWQSRSFGDQVLNSLTAGKIVAGTVTADITVSGQFATALTGQRAGINSLGLFAYNSAGTKTVDLNGVSNLLTGTLQTALTGRRIVTGASGATGEMTFYATDGTASFVRSLTESSGIEALQFGVPGGTSNSPLWNRLNMNSDEWTNLRSNKIDLNYLTGGFFAIRQLSSRNTTATSTTRMQIDASSSMIFAPDNATLYQVSNGAHTFYPANSATSGWVKIKPNLISDSNFRTPYIEFASDNNGVSGAGAYTSLIKFIVRSGGVNPAFQFRNGDDTAYQTIEAANVTGSSSMKVKTDYEDFTGDPLALLRPIKLRKFRRIGQDPATPKELGIFAEEVPAEMGTNPGDDGRPTMVTFLPSLALLIGSVQQLADRLDRLEKRP